MKLVKLKLSVVAVVGLSVMMPLAAMGNTVDLRRFNGYFSGDGGEFSMKPIDGPLTAYVSSYSPKATKVSGGATYIQSFCLETQENVTIPGTYHYDLSDSAIKGGAVVSDPVSSGVGWLFSQFARGILSGYSYTPGAGRVASAKDLQDAIWYLEAEDLTVPLTNPFLVLVGGKFTGGIAGAASTSGFYIPSGGIKKAADFGVGAVNLGDAPTYPAQDQIYYNKHGDTTVPDGGSTLVLLGMAFVCINSVRRRFCLAS
ncbi:MAG: VPDSG-CTERM sorting domain-containing protein [Verrucomicrobia bacterium]|nr:VPDSG-CTERM sorting domain-containing protein [Verrucomicrobiota bacterium]